MLSFSEIMEQRQLSRRFWVLVKITLEMAEQTKMIALNENEKKIHKKST